MSPVTIIDGMQALADLIAVRTDRPVTCDPAKLSTLPAVLVEPPVLSGEPVGWCGAMGAEFTVLVVGNPGTWPQLVPLAELLNEVLTAIAEDGPGWISAEPVAYAPLNVAGQADGCPAYRITLEGANL